MLSQYTVGVTCAAWPEPPLLQVANQAEVFVDGKAGEMHNGLESHTCVSVSMKTRW